MPDLFSRPFRFTCLIFLAMSLSIPARTAAQDANAGVVLAPFAPVSSLGPDHINLMNSSRTVEIPIASYPQRGGKLALDLVLYYVDNGYQLIPAPTGCRGCQAQWVWNGPGFQIIDKQNVAWLRTTTTVGGQTFHADWVSDWTGSSYAMASVGSTEESTAGTSHRLDPTAGIATDASGIRSQVWALSPGFQFCNADAFPCWQRETPLREDPNGNKITFTDGTNGTAVGWTDTLGRFIPGPAATSDTSGCLGPLAITKAAIWNLPGPNGGTSPVKLCYVSQLLGSPAKSYYLLQSVRLPNNTSWTFQYASSSPEISQITTPTGATISYTFGSGPATIQGCKPLTAGGVVGRTVNLNDGSAPETWTYAYTELGAAGTPSSPPTITTTVTDPLGNDTVHVATGLGGYCNTYETSVQHYQGSKTAGTILKTVSTAYLINPPTYQGPGINPNYVVPIRVTESWANGQTTKTETDYDPGFGVGPIGLYGLQTAVREYDYGNGAPGPLLRQVKTSYMALSGPNAASYLANNLLSIPYTVQTLDGSGAQKAFTQYNYDESSLAPSGLTSSNEWDPAPPAGAYRGNNTSTYRWLNSGSLTCQSGSQGGSGSNIISHTTFFDDGNVQTATDPCGNAKTSAYSLTYSGAFPTTVTNALNQSTSNAFDFNTGLPTSTTDPNNLTTSFSYDNMWRLSQVNHPDGAIDSVTHQESSFPFTATLNRQINPSQIETSTNVFDGLGRVKQTQLTSDPQGTDYTDTTYDALGRVATVSNPYRTGSDITTTSGITTYGYDALSRKTSETYPDNSVLTTAYCGPSTLVTDPTNRWRRSRVDGLGRLVEVDEPNAVGATVASTGCPGTGEPIWVTTYGYDTLGNLASVLQNGSHSRSFSFDSFSRLLSSTNPEVGTITYAHWPDGPLHTKTDARSITTTYLYDALHRETSRSYSNGDPTVTTAYDQSACLGLSACQNIGQRTSRTDSAGSEAWSYQVDATNHRSVHVNQRTTSGITKTSTYYLDLAGNVTQAVYPTGRIVNYTFDAANRPKTAADGSNGITYATDFQTVPTGCLAGAVCYTPQGTFYALSIGQATGFTGLNLTHTYNNRLQPNEFKASSSGGNPVDISYNFLDGNGHNAGHVYGITNNLDSTRSQTFAYDQLNRLTSAATTSTYSTSPSHCWSETYSLDAWANLNSIASTTNPNYTGCSQESGFSTAADGSNHLPSWAYDASGNTSGDGVNTYFWNGESQLQHTGGAIFYGYDGDGRRVAKGGGCYRVAPLSLVCNSTPPTIYWYGSGDDILAETDGSGNTTAEYVFFGGKRVAMVPGNALPNGGFEQGSQNWSPCGGAQVITDSTRAHSGGNFLWGSTSTYACAVSSQFVPVSPGNQITFGGWVYLESGNSYLRWILVPVDANHNQVGSGIAASPNTVSAGAWTQEVGTYTVASGVAYVYTYCEIYLPTVTTAARFDDGFISFGSSANTNPMYYVEDLLGTSRVLTDASGVICYDADFYPYGGERSYTNTCPQNYKFEGKERDTETGNDDFGARYYSNRFGRWLSADWSAVPVPVPYANLSNPQTLNLYAMVSDDPESFADLDGHCPPCIVVEELANTPEGQWVIDNTIGLLVAGGAAAYAESKGWFNKAADFLLTNTTDPQLQPYIDLGRSVGEQNAMQSENTASDSKPAASPPSQNTSDKPGEVYVTEPQPGSNKEYVGRTTQGTDQRMATRTDGRTGKATVVDKYKTTEEGRYKEQKQMDQRGGKENLDNKRNEVNPQKMKELDKKYGNQQNQPPAKPPVEKPTCPADKESGCG